MDSSAPSLSSSGATKTGSLYRVIDGKIRKKLKVYHAILIDRTLYFFSDPLAEKPLHSLYLPEDSMVECLSDSSSLSFRIAKKKHVLKATSPSSRNQWVVAIACAIQGRRYTASTNTWLSTKRPSTPPPLPKRADVVEASSMGGSGERNEETAKRSSRLYGSRSSSSVRRSRHSMCMLGGARLLTSHTSTLQPLHAPVGEMNPLNLADTFWEMHKLLTSHLEIWRKCLTWIATRVETHPGVKAFDGAGAGDTTTTTTTTTAMLEPPPSVLSDESPMEALARVEREMKNARRGEFARMAKAGERMHAMHINEDEPCPFTSDDIQNVKRSGEQLWTTWTAVHQMALHVRSATSLDDAASDHACTQYSESGDTVLGEELAAMHDEFGLMGLHGTPDEHHGSGESSDEVPQTRGNKLSNAESGDAWKLLRGKPNDEHALPAIGASDPPLSASPSMYSRLPPVNAKLAEDVGSPYVSPSTSLSAAGAGGERHGQSPQVRSMASPSTYSRLPPSMATSVINPPSPSMYSRLPPSMAGISSTPSTERSPSMYSRLPPSMATTAATAANPRSPSMYSRLPPSMAGNEGVPSASTPTITPTYSRLPPSAASPKASGTVPGHATYSRLPPTNAMLHKNT